MSDRRFELRLRRNDSVDFVWQDKAGTVHRPAATLSDISLSGAAVRVQRPVLVATKVTLVYQEQTFIGTVKHCAPRDGAYLLGIEFDAGYSWSPRPE